MMDELRTTILLFLIQNILFSQVLGKNPQAPYFTSEPSNVIVKRGDKVILECSASGDPQPKILWKRNEYSLNLDTDTRRRILPSGALQIDQIIHEKRERPDEGIYQCVAISEGFSRTYTLLSRPARLDVASMSAKFSLVPQDKTVQIGDVVQMNCKPKSSIPSPVTTWKHEDNIITQNNRFTILPSGSLQIHSVNNGDAGRYKCIVDNDMASRQIESDYATLTVVKASTVPSSRPIFVAVPRDTNVTKSQDVILECAVNSNPSPVITWMKGSFAIPLAGRIQLVGGSNLKISNAEESDGGMYSCVASTGGGLPIVHMGYLKVQDPPLFIKKPQRVIAEKDSATKFECVVSGAPKPTISWYKEGDRIYDSDFMKIGESYLMVIGLVFADQGLYQCIATNALGSVQASAELVVYKKGEEKPTFPPPTTPAPSTVKPPTEELPTADSPDVGGAILVPSAPQEVQVQIMSSSSVAILWGEPEFTHGLPILNYRVMYGENGKGLDGIFNTPEKLGQITNLTPGKTYQFIVFAYNKNGAGQVSDKVTVTLQDNIKSDASDNPRKLKAFAISPSEIQVEWTAPASTEPVTGYNVYYKESGSGSVSPTVEETTDISMRLSGLEANTEYRIWVAAYNQRSKSETSNVVSVSTKPMIGPSSAPVNVRLTAKTPKSLMVEWDPPPKDSLNGSPIKTYNIKLRNNARRNDSRVIKVPATITSRTITGLKRETEYAVRVAVETEGGVSEFSKPWKKATTLNTLLDETVPPGQPKRFTAQVVSNTIALSWEPPEETHVAVQRYELGYGSGDPYQFTKNISAGDKGHVLRKLDPLTTYYIKLSACNIKGCGRAKQIVRTTEQGVVPKSEPLKELRAVAQSSSSIRLSWRETQITSARKVYNIKYRRYNSTKDLQSYNTSKTLFLISGLKPDTYYSFFVKRDGEPWQRKPSVINNTQEGVPSAPADLTSVYNYSDPTVIELQWQIPDHPNGQIVDYKIYYTTDATIDDSQQAVKNTKKNVFSTKLSELTKNTKYYIKIQAKTKIGWGSFSEVLEVTTLLAPYVPSPTDSPALGVGDTDAIAGQGEGEFDNKTLWIIIAGVAGVTFIAIIIISVILCMRRSGNDLRPRKPAYRPTYKAAVAANGSLKKKGGKEEKNKKSDLWISHEQTEMTNLTTQAPPSSSPVSPGRVPKIAEEMEPLQKAPLDQQKLDHQRNSFLSSDSGNSEPSTPTECLTSQPAPVFTYPSEKIPIDDPMPSPPTSPEDPMLITPEKNQDAPLFHSTPRQKQTLPRSLSLDHPKYNDYPDYNTSFPAPPRHHSYDPLEQDLSNTPKLPPYPSGNRTYNAPYSPKKSPDQPYNRAPGVGYRPPGRYSPNGYVTLPARYDDIPPKLTPSAKSVEIMNDLDKEIAGLEGLMKDLNAITAQHYRV